MRRRVFVDTSGWYALIDRRDDGHARTSSFVQDWLRSGGRLVSSDYVLDESFTLARARSGSRAAFRLMELIERTAALDLEWVGAERFNRARTMFRQYDDQTFSFTDCTSFVVMRELELTDALTSDDHFRKAGFELVPAP
jgi:hypothetical protein